MLNIGILHPGVAGTWLAEALKDTEHMCYWVSEGRSEKSRKRALDAGLSDAFTMQNFVQICDLIICVCAPAHAEQTAHMVLNSGFDGIYLEANPILPDMSQALARQFERKGAIYIDGSLLHKMGGSSGLHLALSGANTSVISGLFENSQTINAHKISDKVGDASMLKLLQSSLSKSYSALMIATWGLADELALREPFEYFIGLDSQPQLDFFQNRMKTSASKAWRFSGELELLRDYTAPSTVSKYCEASAEVFRAVEGLKDQIVPIDEVIAMYRDNRA